MMRNTTNQWCLAVLLVSMLGSGGCGGSKKADCEVGSRGCDCTPGGACDAGLVCVDGRCVPGDASTDGAVDGDDDVGVDGVVDGVGDPVLDVLDEDGSTDTPTDFIPEMPPSCEGRAEDECGGFYCCESLELNRGWFAMGRGEETACSVDPTPGGSCTVTSQTCWSSGWTWGCPEGSWIDLGGDDHASVSGGEDETPEHAVWVSTFALDMFEVTVGRMRAFVEAYDKTALLALLHGGGGEHPVVGGSGWDSGWDARLPDDRTALEDALTCHEAETWTGSAGAHETYPINCVSWFVAYAFCAWDGGRLPTEAEWEYAGGGDANLLYPWGSEAPSGTHANYLDTDNTSLLDVFAKPGGAAPWGHHGMGGSMWEWVLDLHEVDWYSGGGADCVDCANVSGSGARTMKGGDWQYTAMDLRGAGRFAGSAGSPWLGAGIRCARDL